MRKLLKTLGLTAVLSCGFAAGAMAADGFATANVNLRAGPSTQYPRVATLSPGAPLSVYGCLGGWSWCDVSFRGYRGWVAGSYIQMMERGNRVMLPAYAPRASIPVVTFNIGSYWDRNYKRESWYGDRSRYDRGPGPGRGRDWHDDRRGHDRDRDDWRDDRRDDRDDRDWRR